MSHEVVVIIGTGGMGAAIARRQGGGRTLVIADLPHALDQPTAQLRAEGFEVTPVPVDVTSKESLTSLAEAASAHGAVINVVHTAGVSPVQAPIETILRVDLLGVALALEVFEGVIAENGAGLVISSMAGHIYPPLPADQVRLLATTPAEALLDLAFITPAALGDPGTAYGIAKQANRARVQAASVDWGRRGARVNSISPGVISTAMGQEELAGGNGEMMRTLVSMSGTGRVGTATDIADAAAFLLGNAASFITGADLLVDGGVVAALAASSG
ncbi:SDR family oxidoreductase [Gordonia sp. zg691]|uniref:SDR family oxidoreductase n=1 Tax=Gordonia jinghuaiqii TaxID=2758710 RepID=UPI0016623FC3|nr:SDR family oxidoreductase [Gordonia jinghuaiqii]MBD0860170.1 SDR family oxidoreductase [Gordonia jinghuaiqii]